jgi:hypothetical protein
MYCTLVIERAITMMFMYCNLKTEIRLAMEAVESTLEREYIG